MRKIALECRFGALLLASLILPVHAEDSPSAPALESASAIRVLLAAELETTLSSQMAGTLGELKAGFGEQVAKAELLARFNCNEAEARAKVAAA